MTGSRERSIRSKVWGWVITLFGGVGFAVSVFFFVVGVSARSEVDALSDAIGEVLRTWGAVGAVLFGAIALAGGSLLRRR